MNTFRRKTIELKQKYASDANMKISSAEDVKESGPLQMMVDVVPDNFFNAASDNRKCYKSYFFQFYSVFH